MIDLTPGVGAVVLAAGQSRRMGRPKLVLPWGEKTVIEQVVNVLINNRIAPIIVVTGGANDQIDTILGHYPTSLVHNPGFAAGEMLDSLQIGLQALPENITACLIALGDQPQIKSGSIQKVLGTFAATSAELIIPSFRMKRGHPWLVGRKYWSELLSYRSPQSLRDFLRMHANEIQYVNVDDESILLDMDTPEDYESHRPK